MTANTNAPRNVIQVQSEGRPSRSIMGRLGKKAVLPALALVLALSALVIWLAQPKSPAVGPLAINRPATGGFAATVPSIPGYNVPYSLRVSAPVQGGFVTTVPPIPGYTVPYPELAGLSSRGEFASSAPLIPGYNMPYNMPPDLWSIITTRAGFDVYESPSAVAIASEDGSAQQ
jgi:hypothetical protein